MTGWRRDASGLSPSLAGPEFALMKSPSSSRERMRIAAAIRSEEHTSELQSLMRISYADFCLKKKKEIDQIHRNITDLKKHEHIKRQHGVGDDGRGTSKDRRSTRLQHRKQ